MGTEHEWIAWVKMRRFSAFSATFTFLVHSLACQLIEANPPKSLLSSTSDLLFLNPAEEFVKDLLEDFCSQLSDGFPEYGLPSLDPLQVPELSFNLKFA